MKSIEEISKKWVTKSLQAYLKDEKNLKWITGISRGMSKDEVAELLSSLGQCGLVKRRNELKEWLNKF